jgi:glycosyltransferase involved in cell wall biosynthesis
MQSKLHIITNMAFWQSPTWTEATTSIYRPDQTGEEFSPWQTARKLFARRKDFEVVHTMGARESLAYGLLCAVFGLDSKQIMTEVFIDDSSRHGLGWQLKTHLYRWVAGRSLGVITNSSREIDTMSARYRLPTSHFHFLPLNTNIERPEWTDQNEGYIFSAGRTLRDYPCLLEAVRDLAVPVHIVCGSEDLTAVHIPDQITLHREIDRTTYLDLLKGSAFVALPLLQTERSTGQVVLLEAMALGKPVITSTAPGTSDYLQDGIHGRLLPAGDVSALREAIRDWLEHPEKADACARRALESVHEKFTVERNAEARIQLLSEIAQGAP